MSLIDLTFIGVGIVLGWIGCHLLEAWLHPEAYPRAESPKAAGTPVLTEAQLAEARGMQNALASRLRPTVEFVNPHSSRTTNYLRRRELVTGVIAELGVPARYILAALGITDGLLARHIRAELTRVGQLESPEAVEQVKQALLDANLVTQDQENRIWLREDVREVVGETFHD